MIANIRLLFLAFVVLLLSNVAYAQEADAGVTPDSTFWGLDRALEQIELLLATGNIEKAKIELKHANERLQEVKVMIEAKRFEDAEKAKIKYEEKIEKVKEKVRNIDSDDDDAVEDEVEIEAEIEEHEQEIDDVERELEIKIKGSLTGEQQAALDALIASFRNSTGKVKIEIKIKRDDIKIKIKQSTGKDDDEIEDEFERAENKTFSLERRIERAREQIKDAEEELNDAREEALETLGSLSGSWPAEINSLFREAETKLTGARAAFEARKYGEAYGLANAAEQLAENIEKKIERSMEGKGRGNRIYQSRNVTECATLQFACNPDYIQFNDNTGCGCERIKDLDDEDEDDDLDDDDLDDCIEDEMEAVEGRTNIVMGRLIISYGDLSMKEGLLDLLGSYNIEVVRAYESIPFFAIKVNEEDTFRWICILEENDRIRDVSFDALSAPT